MLQGKQRSANGGNILINQGPHGDESVSNASHFLPRILSPTTKLGKTLKAARSASTGFTGPAERQARGKALPPGEESDASGPRVRMRGGSLAAAGSSPPGPQGSPRKPVLSQTTAPSLGGKALIQISKQQSTCAFLLQRSGEELLLFGTLKGEKEKENKKAGGGGAVVWGK